MWWLRALSGLIGVALIAACGFQPMYGGGKSGRMATELAAVKIHPIANRSGQQLRNHLLDLLTPYGQPERSKYSLKVTTNEGTSQLAVKKSEIATRANLRISAHFALTDSRTAEALFKGTSTTVGSYNILSSDFSTLIAEKDARARVIRNLALDIQTRLSAYFQLRSGPGRPAAP